MLCYLVIDAHSGFIKQITYNQDVVLARCWAFNSNIDQMFEGNTFLKPPHERILLIQHNYCKYKTTATEHAGSN